MSVQDQNEDFLLAGEYVIGVLDGAERDRFERRSVNEAALREHIAYWQERFAELDHGVTAKDIPAALWSRIEAAIGGGAAVEPAKQGVLAALWSSLAFWRGAGLAGAFASVLLAIGIGLLAGRATPSPRIVAVMLTPEGVPGAIAEVFHDGRISIVPISDFTVPQGKTLQVWTLFDKEKGPVSIGLIERTRQALFHRSDLPAGQQQLYEITLEPEGGSPTNRPTGPVLVKGLGALPRL
ncbi:MAG TPA: anti-sigma factor [Xanthobacteraceae bacterium]|nr:anti-sigma factor [Xanthobacteraceae bacterium]